MNCAHLSHGLKDIFLRCHVLLDKFPGRLVLLEFNVEYFRHLFALMDDQFLGDVVLHHLLSELLCQHPPLILHLINLAQEPPDLKKNDFFYQIGLHHSQYSHLFKGQSDKHCDSFPE